MICVGCAVEGFTYSFILETCNLVHSYNRSYKVCQKSTPTFLNHLFTWFYWLYNSDHRQHKLCILSLDRFSDVIFWMAAVVVYEKYISKTVKHFKTKWNSRLEGKGNSRCPIAGPMSYHMVQVIFQVSQSKMVKKIFF